MQGSTLNKPEQAIEIHNNQKRSRIFFKSEFILIENVSRVKIFASGNSPVELKSKFFKKTKRICIKNPKFGVASIFKINLSSLIQICSGLVIILELIQLYSSLQLNVPEVFWSKVFNIVFKDDSRAEFWVFYINSFGLLKKL